MPLALRTLLGFTSTHTARARWGVSDGEIAQRMAHIFPMRPFEIEQRFALRTPIYTETAAYGHMGRATEVVTKTFKSSHRPTG